MLLFLAKLPSQRGAWATLSLSCFALLLTALYFQYQLGLEPCVKCIYQRTAIIALGVAGFIGWLAPQRMLARLIGYAGWLTAAIWGWRIAAEHVAMQNAKNSWFMVCDAFPNFPSWMPLHHWFPSLFAAPGQCGEIDWSWLGLSMPGWMQINFAFYTLAGIFIICARLLKLRRL